MMRPFVAAAVLLASAAALQQAGRPSAVGAVELETGASADGDDDVYGVAFHGERWRIAAVPPAPPVHVPLRFLEIRADCPLPPSSKFHSQSSEDYDMYCGYFQGKYNGSYVEIGALDGLRFSNTKFFEEKLNWSGVLIEATPRSAVLLERNRGDGKNSIFAEGVCPEAGHMNFIIGEDGAVNGNPDTMSDSFEKQYHASLEEESVIEVPCRPLGSMLRKHMKRHDVKGFDFFSLDVEGGELAVLQTMDWRVPIGVWVVEMDEHNVTKNQAVRDLLFQKGYVKNSRVPITSDRNEWFERPGFVHERVRERRQACSGKRCGVA